MADPGSEHAVPRLLSEEETRSLIALARSGQAEAAEKLLKHNSRLIKSIVLRFEGRGVEFDDLYQIGSLGMLKAIDRFDPAKGVKFSTYAVTVIMGEIRQYLRDDLSVFRLARLSPYDSRQLMVYHTGHAVYNTFGFLPPAD